MDTKNGWGKEIEGTVQLRGEIYEKRSDMDRWGDKTVTDRVQQRAVEGNCTRQTLSNPQTAENRLYSRSIDLLLVTCSQGFMQDNMIASHTCFGGHMDVNC